MTIQEQIEVLTQELRPLKAGETFYYFNSWSPTCMEMVWEDKYKDNSDHLFYNSEFASTNKAEVEEYADCYRRLKLYQLLGKKAEKEFPVIWHSTQRGGTIIHPVNYGIDFYSNPETGFMKSVGRKKVCVFGGVWFAREEDRLHALKVCSITKEFQERCAKYGLGGC